jgi:D-aminopeptidase
VRATPPAERRLADAPETLPAGVGDRSYARAMESSDRSRFRALGASPGVLAPGPWNAITDVDGVRVGHATLIAAEDVRTGVTAIVPHALDPYRERVPAGICVGNGFGKLIGSTQVRELGELETPVLLTNTLAAARVADALIDWTLRQRGNEEVRSVNPFVGETNDGRLNDIRARGVTAEHAFAALAAAASGPVAGGNVGAGTGTVAFGFKGGIGTASRVLDAAQGGWTLGALVQANFGGVLCMDGLPVGRTLGRGGDDADGSIMVVLATDAPLSERNLERLATRAMAGLARTGAAMSNGSGDYAVAFSTALEVRRRHGVDAPPPRAPRAILDVANDAMSPLFLAAIEATEEAILDALCLAQTMRGHRGRTVEALPLESVRAMIAAAHEPR